MALDRRSSLLVLFKVCYTRRNLHVRDVRDRLEEIEGGSNRSAGIVVTYEITNITGNEGIREESFVTQSHSEGPPPQT